MPAGMLYRLSLFFDACSYCRNTRHSLPDRSGKNLPVSRRIGSPVPTCSARTNRPQVFKGIYAGAVAILPSEFDGIVPHRANILEPCLRHRNEFALRAVSLTECARTVPTKIFLRVLSHVAVVPGDPNDAFRFDVIDFDWKLHLSSELNETIAQRRHKADLGPVDQISARSHVRPVKYRCIGHRDQPGLCQ